DHGVIRLEVMCGNRRLDDLVIAAGAGSAARTYLRIPAGTTCTVREISNGGAPGSLNVVVTGSRAVVIPAPGGGIISLTDYYYTQVHPTRSLLTRKTVNGGAAADHGEIRLEVMCGNERLDDFVIAAGAGSRERRFDGIAAGTTCTVYEIEDGSSSGVHVEITGDRTVEIPASGVGEIHLLDTYTASLIEGFGSLIVSKTITGAAAGRQGAITTGVTCGGAALPDFTIAAGEPSGTVSHRYDGIPTGSICTVIDTATGQTSTVAVGVTGGGAVVMPAGGTETLALTDTFSSDPGTLVVNKTIAGPAAGQQGPVTIQVSCNRR